MKSILIFSIVLNVALISFTSFRYLTRPHRISQEEKTFAKVRKEVLKMIPIDSTDVVFVGNSIMSGFPVAELFGAKNMSVGGNRIYHIQDRIGDVVRRKPSKIFLMVGINDIRDRRPVKEVFDSTTPIIDSIKLLSPGTKIFIQSTLPALGFEKPVNEYNELLKEYCDRQKIEYINLSTMFKEYKSLSYDGLHPNAKGYAIWRDEIKKYL